MKHTIKPIGSILGTDADGFIVKTVSEDKVQSKWRPAVDMAVSVCKQQLGDELHSLYVRGSVAKGEAIDGISDIDVVVIVNAPLDSIDTKWTGNLTSEIEKKHPFINGVEFMFGSVNALGKGHKLVIKTQTVCLYGSDLTDELPPLKPGSDTVMHARNLGINIKETADFLSHTKNEKAIRKKCAWVMKRVVRTGCELVMERSGKYTRDLYPCYELFSEYYPEKQSDMYRVLELAVNPSKDAREIQTVLYGIGVWVARKAEFIQGEKV